jgi:arylformamidase
MKIYDISMTISKDIQVYKNKEEKKPVFENASNFETGTSYETILKFNLHTGTHMDFPLHMIKNGDTSDTLDLSKLITPVKVFDLTHVNDAIKDTDLISLDIKENDFILLKTKNSYEEYFNFQFVYIHESASKYLADKKIKGVGIDALGVERDQIGHPTHKHLMHANIIIIEGLRLKDVSPKTYQMFALPIKIKEVDALPLSVILIEDTYDSTSNTK